MLTVNRKCIADTIHADEELRIAGAVKDGIQVVVEPLSYSLLYPESREGGRTMQLAQHLLTLSSCLEVIAGEIMRCGILNPRCCSFLESNKFYQPGLASSIHTRLPTRVP
jgi:hypothetical protein